MSANERLTRDQYRYFLKDSVRLAIDFAQTDQAKGKPAPPIEKPFTADSFRIDLPAPDKLNIPPMDLAQAIRQRESRRQYLHKPISLDELAFLLWATQGIRRRINVATALRTVPSAGGRHALETYLGVANVTGLKPGFYRYPPIEHQLLLEYEDADPGRRLSEAALGQTFLAMAAVTFIWTTIPYRMEWRYDLAAHKVIAIDAGHICQNLYLVCEAIHAGACAVAAYDQTAMDRLLRLDGNDEFVIYLAPVGKV
jgi:SagB-type dehydrogenase family enzyme